MMNHTVLPVAVVQDCEAPSAQERTSKVFTYVGGSIWVILLAALWSYEEPHKATTILVFLSVFWSGALAIGLAKRSGIVVAEGNWLIAFLLKIGLSFLITTYFWAAPLSPNQLRAIEPGLLLQDSMLYDYDAVAVAEHGFFAPEAPVTGAWLSLGIVRYIAGIYSLFGVSVIYVSMWNTLFSLAGFLFLAGMMRELDGDNKKWQILRFGMLLPLGSFYDSTPAKEPLTHAFYLACLYFLAKLLFGRRSYSRHALLTVLSLGALGLVRANLAILLVGVNCIHVLKRLRARGSVLIALCVTVSVLVAAHTTGEANRFLAELVDANVRFSLLESNYLEREASGGGGLHTAVVGALLPRDFQSLLVFAPIRPLLWIVTPYPAIAPNLTDIASMPGLLGISNAEYIGLVTDVAAQVNIWLLLLASPFILASILDPSSRQRHGFTFLLINVILPAIIVANLMFIMGRRYRILIEPLLFAMAIWGNYYGRPARYRWPLYLTGGAGVLLYSAYSAV